MTEPVPRTLYTHPDKRLLAIFKILSARKLDLSWLEILYSHVHNGNRESAGDLLFERIDDLLCDELFQDADNTIRTIDVGRLDSYALVGLLSVTYAARRELPSRAPMVRRIEARLAVVAPGRVEELMAGLR